MNRTNATASGIDQQIESLRRLRGVSSSARLWRWQVLFFGHRVVANAMWTAGIPLTEALLLLFNKRERFTKASK